MSVSVALYTLPDGCKVVIIDIIVPVTGQARASPVTDLHAQIDRLQHSGPRLRYAAEAGINDAREIHFQQRVVLLHGKGEALRAQVVNSIIAQVEAL